MGNILKDGVTLAISSRQKMEGSGFLGLRLWRGLVPSQLPCEFASDWRIREAMANRKCGVLGQRNLSWNLSFITPSCPKCSSWSRGN